MQQLLNIMQTLREKCPWDQAQTPMSLTPYAIEEAYEVEDAIRRGDVQHIKEELGDLLLQVVFQARMYEEQGDFNFQDVIDVLKQKLIRRHPHVFDVDQPHLDEVQVKALWSQIKSQEKKDQSTQFESRLDRVKLGTSLHQAQQLQRYAAELNFDWEHVEGALEKLDEEVLELKEAIKSQDVAHITEELGDSFFALVNVGRKLDQDCDASLRGTIHKFRQRFAYIEQQLAIKNLQPEQCDLDQLDQLWNDAKKIEKYNL